MGGGGQDNLLPQPLPIVIPICYCIPVHVFVYRVRAQSSATSCCFNELRDHLAKKPLHVFPAKCWFLQAVISERAVRPRAVFPVSPEPYIGLYSQCIWRHYPGEPASGHILWRRFSCRFFAVPFCSLGAYFPRIPCFCGSRSGIILG
jgi:hypothetical protein